MPHTTTMSTSTPSAQPLRWVLIATFCLFGALSAQAQMVQVDFAGFPPGGALASPYLSDLEARVEDGTYGLRVTVVGASAQRFRLRFLIEIGGALLTPVDTRPISREPGTHFVALDDLSFVFTGGFDQYLRSAGSLTGQLVRTGRLPNGTTALTVEALDDDGMLLGDATIDLEARLPEPPPLLMPADQTALSQGEPLIFAWDPISTFDLPVGARAEYELTIARFDPLLHQGNSENAILQPLDGEFVTYGPAEIAGAQVTHWKIDEATGLMLQAGETYAWRVEARVFLADGTRLDGLFNDGFSDIFTFEYEAEEVLWAFPLFGNPLVEFDLTGSFETDGLVGDARYGGRLLGEDEVADFEGVQIRSGSFLAGRLVLTTPLRIVHSLDDEGRVASAFAGTDARPGGLPTALPPSGIRFVLDPFVLTPFGLTTTATQVQVDANLPGVQGSSFRADVSPGFALDAQTYEIARGQMTLYDAGVPIAVYDRRGLRMPTADDIITPDDDIIAPPPPADFALPEVAPLVSERIGVLTLRAGDTPLVAYADGAAGRVRLSSLPGQTAPLRLDVLPGAPVVDIAFSDLGYDPTTGRIVRGDFEAQLPEPVALPGTPYVARRIAFDGAGGLLLYGDLVIGETAITSGSSVALRVGAAGQFVQAIDQSGLGALLPLADGASTERGAVEVERVQGELSGTTTVGSVRLTMAAALRIGATDAPGVRIPLGLRYEGDDLNVSEIGTPTVGAFDLNGMRLAVSEVRPGFSVRTNGSGFSFDLPLAASLQLPLERGRGAQRLVVPLPGLKLTPSGMAYAPFDLHDALPGFPEQTVQLEAPTGALRLDLLAIRSDAGAQFDYFNWDGNAATNLAPTFDFDVSQTGADAPLSGIALTLQDAEYDENAQVGALVGEGIRRDVAPTNRPTFAVGGATFRTAVVDGSFFADDGLPSYALTLDAQLAPIGPVADDAECTAPTMALTLTPTALSGQASGMNLCGSVAVAPFDLTFSGATLEIERTADAAAARVVGTPTVTLGVTQATVEGTLTVALNAEGAAIVSGEAVVSSAFNLNYGLGAEGGVLNLRAPGAILNASGTVVDGDGVMKLGEVGESRAAFDQLVIGSDGQIAAGSVAFSDPFALHLPVANAEGAPLTVVGALSARPSGTPTTRGLLAIQASGATLDSDGLTVATTSGTLHIGEEARPVVLEQDAFAVTTGVTRGFSGRLDVNSGAGEDATRLAVLEADGFRLDQYVPSGLPLRIPLGPSLSLLTADADGTPLVEAIAVSGGSFDVRPIGGSLVLDLQTTESGPVVSLRATPTSRLTLSSSYQVNDVLIVAEPVDGSSVDLSPLGVPVRIEQMVVRRTPTANEVTATGAFALPAAFANVAPAFSGADVSGGWSALARPAASSGDAIVSAAYQGGALRVDIVSVETSGQGGAWTFEGAAYPTYLASAATPAPRFGLSGTFQGGAWQVTTDAPTAFGTYRIEESELAVSSARATLSDIGGYVLAFDGTLSLPGPDGVVLTVQNLSVGTDTLSAGDEVSAAQDVSVFGGSLTMQTTFVPSFDRSSGILRLSYAAQPTQTATLLGAANPLTAGAARPVLYADGTMGTTGGGALPNPAIALNPSTTLRAGEARIAFEAVEGISARPILVLPVAIDLPSVVHPATYGQGDEGAVSATMRLFRASDGSMQVRTGDIDAALLGTRYPLDERSAVQLDALALTYNTLTRASALRGVVTAWVPHDGGGQRAIRFGDAERPGLFWGFKTERKSDGTTEALKWKLAPKLMQPSDLSVPLDGIAIHAQRFALLEDKSTFGVQIGGKIGFGHGFFAVAQWNGLVFDAGGLSSIGTNDGAFSISVAGGLVALDVGRLVSVSDTTITLQRPTTTSALPAPGPSVDASAQGVIDSGDAQRRTAGDDDPLDPETVDLKRLWRFENDGKADAIKVSIARGFLEGGVDEILYYEKTNGGVHFALSRAHFRLKLPVTLDVMADVSYDAPTSGTSDEFSIRIGGRIMASNAPSTGFEQQFKEVMQLAKGPTRGGVLVGRITNIGGQEGGGVFGAVTTDRRLGPVSMKGMGFGYFHNPTVEDVNTVMSMLRFKPVGAQPDLAVESATGLALAYGKFGMVQYSGDALLQVSDTYFKLDGRAQYEGLPPDLLDIGLFVTADWSGGADNFNLAGAAYLKTFDPPVFNSFPDVKGQFALNFKDGDVDYWFAEIDMMNIAPGKKAKLLGLSVGTRLLMSSDGYLNDFQLNRSFPLKPIISAYGQVEGSSWYYKPQNHFGIAAGLEIGVSVAGGAVVGRLHARGTYLNRDGDDLIYLSGTAGVKVVGLYEGTVTGWVAIHNDRVEGGTGENNAYADIIAASRAQLQTVQTEMDKVRANVIAVKQEQAAMRAVFDRAKAARVGLGVMAFSADDFNEIEQSYVGGSFDEYPTFSETLLSARSYDGTIESGGNDFKYSVPARFHYVWDGVLKQGIGPMAVLGEYQPDLHRDEMTLAIEEMETRSTEVAEALAAAELTLALVTAEADEQATQAQAAGAAVTITRTETAGGYTTGFQIPTTAADNQVDALLAFADANEEVQRAYRAALDSVVVLSERLEASTHGENGVLRFLPLYRDAYQAVGKHYSRKASFLSDVSGWAGLERERLQAVKTEVSVNTARETATLSDEEATTRYTAFFSERRDLLNTLYTKVGEAIDPAFTLPSPTSSATLADADSVGQALWFKLPHGALGKIQEQRAQELKTLYTDYQQDQTTTATAYQDFSTDIGSLLEERAEFFSLAGALSGEYAAMQPARLSIADEAQRLRRRFAVQDDPAAVRSTKLTRSRVVPNFSNSLKDLYWNSAFDMASNAASKWVEGWGGTVPEYSWSSGHYAEALTLTWSAVDSSTVSEAVVRIEEPGGTTRNLSVGTGSSFTHYVFDHEDFDDDSIFKLSVALRNGAGVLGAYSTPAEVEVSFGQGVTPPVAGSGGVLAQETAGTLPAPSLRYAAAVQGECPPVADRAAGCDAQCSRGGAFCSASGSPGTFSVGGSADRTRVDLAVGTTPTAILDEAGAALVHDFKTGRVAPSAWTRSGGGGSAAVPAPRTVFPGLQAGQTYYLFARSANAQARADTLVAGDTLAIPFVFDTSAPSISAVPTGTERAESAPAGEAIALDVSEMPTSLPDRNGGSSIPTAQGSVRLVVDERESDVLDLAYTISPHPTAQAAFAPLHEGTEVRAAPVFYFDDVRDVRVSPTRVLRALTGDQLSWWTNQLGYDESLPTSGLRIHAKVTNTAGATRFFSADLPEMSDATPPPALQAAQVQAVMEQSANGAQRARFYVLPDAVGSNTDPETGVVGYQFAWGTSPGADDLIAWPESGTVQLTQRAALARRNYSSYVPGAPTSEAVLLSVRPVNGAGIAGAALSWTVRPAGEGLTIERVTARRDGGVDVTVALSDALEGATVTTSAVRVRDGRRFDTGVGFLPPDYAKSGYRKGRLESWSPEAQQTVTAAADGAAATITLNLGRMPAQQIYGAYSSSTTRYFYNAPVDRQLTLDVSAAQGESTGYARVVATIPAELHTCAGGRSVVIHGEGAGVSDEELILRLTIPSAPILTGPHRVSGTLSHPMGSDIGLESALALATSPDDLLVEWRPTVAPGPTGTTRRGQANCSRSVSVSAPDDFDYQSGEQYVLLARAIGRDGRAGETLAAPFRIDRTAPQVDVVEGSMTYERPGEVTVYGQSLAAGLGEADLRYLRPNTVGTVSLSESAASTPSVTIGTVRVDLAVSDANGIGADRVGVAQVTGPDVDPASARWTWISAANRDTVTATIDADPARSTILVRAIDRLGNDRLSDAYQLPIASLLPAQPTPPLVTARLTSLERADLFFADAGTPDVLGYQVAVGTTPGGTQLRDWPEGSTLNLPPLTSDERAALQNAGASTVSLSDLPVRSFRLPDAAHPVDQPFYVSVRAVYPDRVLSAPVYTRGHLPKLADMRLETYLNEGSRSGARRHAIRATVLPVAGADELAPGFSVTGPFGHRATRTSSALSVSILDRYRLLYETDYRRPSRRFLYAFTATPTGSGLRPIMSQSFEMPTSGDHGWTYRAGPRGDAAETGGALAVPQLPPCGRPGVHRSRANGATAPKRHPRRRPHVCRRRHVRSRRRPSRRRNGSNRITRRWPVGSGPGACSSAAGLDTHRRRRERRRVRADRSALRGLGWRNLPHLDPRAFGIVRRPSGLGGGDAGRIAAHDEHRRDCADAGRHSSAGRPAARARVRRCRPARRSRKPTRSLRPPCAARRPALGPVVGTGRRDGRVDGVGRHAIPARRRGGVQHPGRGAGAPGVQRPDRRVGRRVGGFGRGRSVRGGQIGVRPRRRLRRVRERDGAADPRDFIGCDRRCHAAQRAARRHPPAIPDERRRLPRRPRARPGHRRRRLPLGARTGAGTG